MRGGEWTISITLPHLPANHSGTTTGFNVHKLLYNYFVTGEMNKAKFSILGDTEREREGGREQGKRKRKRKTGK
jgi:hypothetical protein